MSEIAKNEGDDIGDITVNDNSVDDKNSDIARKIRHVSISSSGDSWSELRPLFTNESDQSFVAARVERRRLISQGKDETQKRNKDLIRSREIVGRWKKAARHLLHKADLWSVYQFENIAIEQCIHHHYDSLKQEWWRENDVRVKLHSESFAHGAMRECYRLKVLSKDGEHDRNCVAKKYVRAVDKNTYFDDVRLQMDSKLWAEDYNRHCPPKKIDIMQMTILEFINRSGSPLYHVERFIEGNYVKYNSNNGFVSEAARFTPQAFSHFTFERSGHGLIIVDIQGVGDLYTDPQIHTTDGREYSDGNLGTRGMALFFHSHECNSICKSLDLTEFDLSANERHALAKGLLSSIESTMFTTFKFIDVCSPLSNEYGINAMEMLRRRTFSSGCYSGGKCSPRSASVGNHGESSELYSVNYDTMSSIDGEISGESCHEVRKKISRPAGLSLSDGERELLMTYDKTRSHHNPILGQIHLDLARYHELGRLVSPGTPKIFDEHAGSRGNVSMYDKESALFHLRFANRCGILEAVVTLAEIILDLPHELLKDVQKEDLRELTDEDVGIELLEEAGNLGDVGALLFVADRYATEERSGGRSLSWPKAINLYKRALSYKAAIRSDETCYSQLPVEFDYLIMKKMADMLKEGGNGLERDLERAYDLYQEGGKCAQALGDGKAACELFIAGEQCFSS